MRLLESLLVYRWEYFLLFVSLTVLFDLVRLVFTKVINNR